MVAKNLPARIMVDIDDTLYPATDLWTAIFRAQAGVDIGPKLRWSFWQHHLRPEEFGAMIREHFHAPGRIRANVPYAGAGVSLRTWAGRGVQIHIVSHRDPNTTRTTRSWLRDHELPYHKTIFAFDVDKVAYCLANDISLLIDDKAATLEAAVAAGLQAATIIHPWNSVTLREHPEIIRGVDWYELRIALEAQVPFLASPLRRRAARAALARRRARAKSELI